MKIAHKYKYMEQRVLRLSWWFTEHCLRFALFANHLRIYVGSAAYKPQNNAARIMIAVFILILADLLFIFDLPKKKPY